MNVDALNWFLKSQLASKKVYSINHTSGNKNNNLNSLDTYVEIKHTNKRSYREEGIVGMRGTVERVSGKEIGVRIDGKRNKASGYGIY